MELGLFSCGHVALCARYVADRTDNGAPLRVLSLIDEFTRQCISLTVARGLKSADIVAALDKAIAKAAGCSVAAVSYALANRPGVSKEKRAHIRKVARQLGY